MKQAVYKITIAIDRMEETLTSKTWVEGGIDNKNEEGSWGYQPQVTQTERVSRTVAEFRVTDLDTKAIILAVIENSRAINDNS